MKKQKGNQSPPSPRHPPAPFLSLRHEGRKVMHMTGATVLAISDALRKSAIGMAGIVASVLTIARRVLVVRAQAAGGAGMATDTATLDASTRSAIGMAEIAVIFHIRVT